ncbi:hypothetical protein AB0F15_08885 [Amycolatopsis sp. NPDC026612]|uniref:hypothetical protein n=1 Tax=Amycolatopsis sp. NPDC026612 TaxID=3155466 RepID=UPI0033C045EE
MSALADLRRARDLAGALDVPRFRDDARDVVLTRILIGAIEDALASGRTGDRARALDRLGAAARERVRELAIFDDDEGRRLGRDLIGCVTRARDAFAPGPATRHLVTIAVLLVPAPHRGRYAEEFRAELAELAGRHRLAYALRLAGGSWRLRRGLRGG